MSLESIIETYGYPVLFLGILIEGETFLILGAYLAHRGYFSVLSVILVASLATFTITQILYAVGHRYGMSLLDKRPAWRKRLTRVEALLHRYGAGLILGFRALLGLRTGIPLVVGALHYPPARFMGLNVVGALSWAVIVGLAGNGIAQAVESLVEDLRRHELTVVVTLAGVAAVWVLVRYSRRIAKMKWPVTQ